MRENAKNAGMKQLLTRADDYGVSPGTNDAILAGIEKGLLKNVGVMAPGPWLEYRLADLRALQRRVCIGLHATLNSEWSLLRWGPVVGAQAVPGLVRTDGSFHEAVDRTHLYSSPEESIIELRCQLRLLRNLGLEPVYLDCHMVFNWHPDWDRAIGDFAMEEGLIYHANGLLTPLRLKFDERAYPQTEAVIELMETEGLGTAMWVFHPAARDAVSEKFFKDPNAPHITTALERDREYRFLTDARAVTPFLSHPKLELIGYDALNAPHSEVFA